MTYTSLNFIFFVLATALVYFVLPFKKYRWTVLLAASIFFYCTWSYQLGAFMLFTTLSTYLIALWLNRVSVKSKAVLKEHLASTRANALTSMAATIRKAADAAAKTFLL